MMRALALVVSMVLVFGCAREDSPNAGDPGPQPEMSGLAGTNAGNEPPALAPSDMSAADEHVGQHGDHGDSHPDDPSGVPDSNSTCGSLSLDTSREIAAGQVLTLCAGTRIRAASGVTLVVRGLLVAEGTSSDPVIFEGETDAIDSWEGIVVEAGGDVEFVHVELRGAALPIEGQSSSRVCLSDFVVEDSTLFLRLASFGQISRGSFHGTGMNGLAAPLVIDAASPIFTDVRLENAGPTTEMTTVLGASSPVFDHMEVSGARCAFHFDVAANAVIKNSHIHDVTHGFIVAGSTATKVENNNFNSNVTHIGSCTGGDAQLVGNYFDKAPFDPSCAMLTNDSPSPSELTDAGPHL